MGKNRRKFIPIITYIDLFLYDHSSKMAAGQIHKKSNGVVQSDLKCSVTMTELDNYYVM